MKQLTAGACTSNKMTEFIIIITLLAENIGIYISSAFDIDAATHGDGLLVLGFARPEA